MQFCTIFPPFEKIHRVKDVGQIPSNLTKKGYKSFAFTRESLPDEKDLRYINFKNKVDLMWKIFKMAPQWDIINIYHLDFINLLIELIYKFRNRDGIVYLKLDMDYRNLNNYKNNCSLKKMTKTKIIKKADIVSVESNVIKNELHNVIEEKEVIYIPDGVADFDYDNTVEREKIILTVGRLGTDQKATEVLLEAFAALECEKEWKLVLAGTIEKEFEIYLKNYFQKNPSLADRIEFVGNISNRKELFRLYQRASIFVLPSRWESFGIVLAEAQVAGTYIITTDNVPAAYDMIVDEDFGEIVPVDNVQALKKTIDKSIIEKKYINHKKISEVSKDKFDWNNICEDIDTQIKKVIKERDRNE